MSIFKQIFLVIVILLLPILAQAEFVVSQLDVKGYGETRSEAVQDALLEAIRQNHGVDIQSKRELVRELPAPGAVTDSAMTTPDRHNAVVRDEVRESVRGAVRQYRVLEAHELAAGRWEARVLVAFTHYKSPGLNASNRRRIAVMPFRTAGIPMLLDGQRVPAEEVSAELVQQVVTELTQSRKFTVLDRDYMDAYLSEKSLLLSPDGEESEMMKMGRVLGVDYMLVGSISGGVERRAEDVLALTGERVQHGAASLNVDYRIIVMPTREVKWSGSERIVLEGSAMPREDAVSAAPDAVRRALVLGAARMIVRRSLDNIYPLRVVGRNAAGEVLVNQGGVTLQDGDLLDVFAAGPGVKDHYTGESLGAVESRIGRIRVVRVAAKKSYAAVVDGELALMADGSICRRLSSGGDLPPVNPGRPTDVRLSEDGGAVLPFDR
ncbi:CsgG/HfaB family protein [Pelodictyon luteolum]|uniref:Periplasmic protein n=1 Tax=Chlorobium luteolum (strain DSM 273 / BCRC 81028 / 2530) TaxID=319225 RepID=Q3B6Q5_CHLL3|nr:CsgG/HfaB family protein [Pelodictyon luteolum]ABB22976.1 periplasmic protein [Pelodictyon luteolum DSM 273]